MVEDFPTLQTARLVLREIVPTDRSAIFKIFGNPAVMRLYGNDPVPDIHAAGALIKTFADSRTAATPAIRWGIALKDDPTLIGTCGLFALNRGWHKCMLGYELDVPWHKKGIMFEALSEVLGWAFYAMLLHRVEAQIHPDNSPSIKLVKSLGFTLEGRLREAGHWGGGVHDMLQFGLLWHELQSLYGSETSVRDP